MDIKLKVFNTLPDSAKVMATLAYIRYRQVREYVAATVAARRPRTEGGRPKVVYVTGFPRSGTTVLKYYFGGFPGLATTEFDPAGFYVTWRRAMGSNNILVDKSNHYIRAVSTIFRAYGEDVAVCCIVRDPRDSLISLLTFPEAREIPRTQGYWRRWCEQYESFLSFAQHGGFGHRIYFLRYEDFVRHPVEAKEDFLSWLGLDTGHDPITDEYSISHPDESVPDKVHEHRSVKTFALSVWREAPLNEPHRAVVEGWRREPRAMKLMEEFGYGARDLLTAAVRSGGFRVFRPRGTPGGDSEPHSRSG